MIPQARHGLSKFELRVVRLVAEGLTDRQIFELVRPTLRKLARLALTVEDITTTVDEVGSRTGNRTRASLAFYVIDHVLLPKERAELVRKAEATRQELIDKHVLTFRRATYALAIASPDTCNFSDRQVGLANGSVSSQTVNHSRAELLAITGNKLWLQVTLYLAPVDPAEWQ